MLGIIRHAVMFGVLMSRGLSRPRVLFSPELRASSAGPTKPDPVKMLKLNSTAIYFSRILCICRVPSTETLMSRFLGDAVSTTNTVRYSLVF